VSSRYAQLVARLWDVTDGRQRLIDRGVMRLARSGSVAFRLNGNAWRFRRGHTIKLELVGRDGPTYRPPDGRFSVGVHGLWVDLPTREPDVVGTYRTATRSTAEAPVS
jgi:predicted acyl esterase